MLRTDNKSKPFLLLLPVGVGAMILVLAAVLLSTGHPVQAQPPAADPLPPEFHLTDVEPLALNQQDLLVSVDYAMDIVEDSYYTTGHTIWITVTNPTGAVKATAELQTAALAHFPTEAPIGYSTREADVWDPVHPDIQPGDTVSVASSDGQETSVLVGTITGDVDVAANTVSGTIDAPDLDPTDIVQVKCRAYDIMGANVQVFDNTVIPDGSDPYICDFGTAWTLEAGDRVVVSYDPGTSAQRGNRVLNVFAVPGPHLQIRKWATGAPGVTAVPTVTANGNIVFNVEVRNIGPEPATNVTIVDTLSGLTYLSDTSGTTPSVAMNTVTWSIGTLAPGARVSFQVFARVEGTVANVGDLVSDTVTVSSAEPNMGFPTERTATWEAAIEGNGSWLSANQRAWTRNPAPGESFVYATSVCNTGFRFSTDSSTATLTETLPAGVTFVEWWAEEPGWTQTSAGAAPLVLTRPALAAHGCTEVYVRVTVAPAATAGTQLCSTATVNADNNLTTTSNQSTGCVTVDTVERPDLSIDKVWSNGQLVPGGELAYVVRIENTGNTAIGGPIQISDTVPEQATFTGAEVVDGLVPIPVAPVAGPAGTVVLEIPATTTLAPGDWAELAMSFDLAAAVEPGTLVTNTVTIGAAAVTEADTANNTATWIEQVQDSGPNLRIRKVGQWTGTGTAAGRVAYMLRAENIGDAVVRNVEVIDIYDAELHLDGNLIFNDIWDDTPMQYPPDPRRFEVSIDELQPGEWVDISFAAVISGVQTLEPGLFFTNTATIAPTANDTAPDDNAAVISNFTGPDLQVTKDLLSGTAAPGEQVVYEITFGNAIDSDDWWWDLSGDALLVDTLPLDMSFVSAQLRECADGTAWCSFPPDQSGQTLTWTFADFPAGADNAIRVTAQIADPITGLGRLVNHAALNSTTPDVDVEANLSNNSATHTMQIGEPPPVTLYMPIITKNAMP